MKKIHDSRFKAEFGKARAAQWEGQGSEKAIKAKACVELINIVCYKSRVD